MLGNLLMSEGQDYQQRQRQLQDEARHRTQQLQDIDSQHAWTQSENDRNNAAVLSREKALQGIRTQDDAIRVLVSEGLLAPADINDPGKIAAASELAKQKGIDQLYSDLLNTPDESGKPILSRDDLGNPQAINTAKAKLSAVKAAKIAFGDSQAKNAQGELGRIAGQINQVQSQAAALDQKLGAPAPALSPDEIQNAAIQIAGQSHPGKPPSMQEIAAAMPQAKQQLEQAALQKWAMDKQDAQVQRGVLSSQLQDLRYQYDALVNKFGVAPQPGSIGGQPAAAPSLGNPQAEASPQQKAAAAAAALAGANKAPPPPTGPGGVSLLANPTSDPMIAAANNRRGATSWQTNLADPYTQSVDKVQDLNARIQAIRQGINPDAPAGDMMYGQGTPIVPLSPDVQAKLLSDALIQQQALMRQSDVAKRAMLGLTPAQVLANPMVPAQNNANGYAPTATTSPQPGNLTDVQSFDFE